jgi:DNA repair exonuclease SbcCD ATPase subunit
MGLYENYYDKDSNNEKWVFAVRENLRVVHIADVHWRGLTRHKEYRKSFERFFNQTRELNPHIILVAGDIVHSKTQGISPELIDCLNWWFTEMSKICKVVVTLGNHDGNLLNLSRQDAISPIITALDNPNILLWKDSGNFSLKDSRFDHINWGNFSCFDEKNWKDIKIKKDKINIAIYHGAVKGSLTDVNWTIEGEVEEDFFHGWDFALLGDIHRHQFLNEKRTIAYPGSTIMQNYGESGPKGFLFWEIKSSDEFDVEFHEVPAVSPFVTLDWSGSVKSTISGCSDLYPPRSRYRIRSYDPIPQIEMKQIQNELKSVCDASEVVFKIDHVVDTRTINTPAGSVFKEDLRDPDTHVRLLKEYLGEETLESKEWEIVDSLVKDYLKRLRKSDRGHRNVSWSLDRMEFDNTFCFGENNVIDFTKTEGGITGVFGRNAHGKSSIMATIMYALFNSTDRGPVKNLHVINIRKGFCRAAVDLRINGEKYRIERQSVKNQTRKGDTHAITSLNFFKYDESGEMIDLCGEQRTETEKVIRDLIGTSEDFLLTTFASQNNMNTFIREGATVRKKILTKFLDLEIFDRMLEYTKDESNEIKGQLKNAPDRDWDYVLKDKSKQRKKINTQIEEKESEITEKRAELQNLQSKLSSLGPDSEIITLADVQRQEKILNETVESRNSKVERIKGIEVDIEKLVTSVQKIVKVKEEFPIEDLRERIKEKKSLQESLVDIRHLHEREERFLQSKQKSIRKLENIPCGDSYPTCKFIKDSIRDKETLQDQTSKVEEALQKIRNLESALDSYNKDDLESRLEKYDVLLQKESAERVLMSEKEIVKNRIKLEVESLNSKIDTLQSDLDEMREHMSDVQEDDETNRLKEEVNILNDEINTLDSERMSLAERRGEIVNSIRTLREERKKYGELRSRWKVYEVFMKAISKTGIPAQIIGSQLPIINQEISNILSGVVDFTVKLEVDETGQGNSMDVYIDYGDSTRIIETASGMEKMISSLAIRVALSNVSSMPKSDVLIVDEGFGTLDDTKIAASNQLLESLKRWFKNILVITHIDSVKDVADNVIEIEKSGKDTYIVYE